MIATPIERSWPQRLLAGARTSFGLVVIAVIAMWFIEALDTWLLNERLQRHGIHPREADGVDGIAWAPFLHSDWGHVASNSVPLLVMGGLVTVRGPRYWALVTLAIVVVGGGATWALGGSGNHIGASGIVYGYFGVLLTSAVVERNKAALGGALIATFLYSGLVVGFVPQPQLSWEGHLFGFLAGAMAAWAMAKPRPVRRDDPADMQPWEADEPWLR